MSKQMYNDDYSEPKNVGQDVSPSKMDDAFRRINERMNNLSKSISILEDRLVPVINNFPRSSNEEPKESPMASEGDSILLVKLYDLGTDITSNEEHVRSLISRLDI